MYIRSVRQARQIENLDTLPEEPVSKLSLNVIKLKPLSLYKLKKKQCNCTTFYQ